MSDETANDPGAADTAPTEPTGVAHDPAGPGPAPVRRATFEVPKWAALVVAGLLLLGIGFAIGWISAPGGGHHHREFPGGPGLPGAQRRPLLPGGPGGQRGVLPGGVFLGITTQNATGTSGAQIVNVVTGTPADQAGLKADDVITAVDGTSVTSSAQLAQAIQAHQPGDQVTLTITRSGASSQVQVKLAARASTAPSQPTAPASPSA